MRAVTDGAPITSEPEVFWHNNRRTIDTAFVILNSLLKLACRSSKEGAIGGVNGTVSNLFISTEITFRSGVWVRRIIQASANKTATLKESLLFNERHHPCSIWIPIPQEKADGFTRSFIT